MRDDECPFVSVVVPVRNDPRVGECLDRLLAQTYPRERYEILVVDNGSSDDTRWIAESRPVTLLVEDGVRSSYAARNLGIRNARGSVIAMIDADCQPAAGWLAEGVAALERESADLIGGGIRFRFSERISGAEVYDALHNMQQEKDVRTRKVAKTANLFVRASVFAAVGLFPPLESGADVYWTRRATDAGCAIAFAPAAEVEHPTRRLRELLRKAFRVGRGRYDRYELEREDASRGRRVPTNPGHRLADMRPPRRPALRRSIASRGLDAGRIAFLRAWLAGWLYRLTMVAGSSVRRAERGLGLGIARASREEPSIAPRGASDRTV